MELGLYGSRSHEGKMKALTFGYAGPQGSKSRSLSLTPKEMKTIGGGHRKNSRIKRVIFTSIHLNGPFPSCVSAFGEDQNSETLKAVVQGLSSTSQLPDFLWSCPTPPLPTSVATKLRREFTATVSPCPGRALSLQQQLWDFYQCLLALLLGKPKIRLQIGCQQATVTVLYDAWRETTLIRAQIC